MNLNIVDFDKFFQRGIFLCWQIFFLSVMAIFHSQQNTLLNDYPAKMSLVLFDRFGGTMRKNLLNWCNLVSISKKLMFYIFGVVRIY